MIYSHIQQWGKERNTYPEAIQRGLTYLESTNFKELPNGKYEIEGDRMFAILQTVITKPKQEQKPESHQAYTDIQYLLEGEELLVYAKTGEDQIVSENTWEENDLAFYETVHHENEVILKPGAFAVFFPSDIHRPCCSTDADRSIRKVVVKVHNSLLL